MTTELDPGRFLYRLPPVGASLLVQEWGDAYAVYQFASGETHFFNEVTATLLDCVGENPCTLEAILMRVADVLGMERTTTRVENFLGVIVRLEELGLVERVNDKSGVISA